jgi:selenocysteine lyase/cysteine desulfurase
VIDASRNPALAFRSMPFDGATPEPQEALLPTWQLSGSRSAALVELERRVHRVLSTYANVHRGSGHHSRVTTALYEHARKVVLEHLELEVDTHTVIFTNPYGAEALAGIIDATQMHVLSSQALGLPLGVRAVVVRRRALPRKPLHSGGGTARLVSPNSAIWEDAPERFEAGTPAIVNVIAFACALRIARRCGPTVFARTKEPAAMVALESSPEDFPSLEGIELMNALRETMLGRRSPVPVESGVRAYVHLDNAASTLTFPAVWQQVRQALRADGETQAELLLNTRRLCTQFVGAPREQYAVIFTSNATEAINAVATSFGSAPQQDEVPVVLNTILEHNSNELPWRRVSGTSPVRLPVDTDGFIDLDALDARLRDYNVATKHGRERIVLVAVSGASNVLGTYNDLEAICRIAHRYGARVLVDAAQLAGHRQIQMAACGIDYLVLSGHKLYAPFGTGALVAKRELLRPQREYFEAINASGEENVGGIAALGKAMQLLLRVGMDVVEREERRLTTRLLEGLQQIPGVELWGIKDPHSHRAMLRGGIVTFSVEHVPHNRVAQELADLGGIGIRTGCHCAHLLVKRLFGVHPLQAKIPDLIMLLFPRFLLTALPGLVRVSLGMGNDDEDVDHFLRTLETLCKRPRSAVDRAVASDHGGRPFLATSPVGLRVNDVTESLLTDTYT